jgi:hypothetical protein
MKYAKTEAGQAALKDRSVKLTPRQRTALLMTDGRRTWPEVQGISGCSPQDWQALVDLQLVASLEVAAFANSKIPEAVSESTMGGVESINFDLEDVPGDPTSGYPELVSHFASQDSVAADLPLANSLGTFDVAHAQMTRLCSSLGLRAFHVGLALQSASNWSDLMQAAQRLDPLLDKAQRAQLQTALAKR